MHAGIAAMDVLENNDNEPVSNASARWSGLGVRAASGVVLVAAFMAVLFAGGWIFTWLIMLAALMMMREWTGLTERDGPMWRFAGLFYVSIPCASLVWLRGLQLENDPQAGLHLVFFIMLIVWATDIGAYFAGRQIGGPKLAPVISPNKTWAGLGGGVGAAFITAGILHFILPYPTSFLGSVILGAVLAIVSQIGDLFESWMKRRVGVKDSGTLIPGHGGLLDRIDGLIFTIPLFTAIVAIAGSSL